MKFLLIRKMEPFLSSDKITRFCIELSGLSKGQKKNCQKETWNQLKEEVDRLPTTADINVYQNNKIRKQNN